MIGDLEVLNLIAFKKMLIAATDVNGPGLDWLIWIRTHEVGLDLEGKYMDPYS